MDTTDRPQPDSHFRLLLCVRCSSEDVVYRSTVTGGRTQFFVKCLGCGQRSNLHICKHDAQIEWNGRFGK